ncbi:GntR family transcriptional regulator [Synergistaceae bacterium OttesenSCG-928-D05]|nr:GntR family transcriptional regulator [Synergistaceae bacterium OttesenSCG-928-D05]
MSIYESIFHDILNKIVTQTYHDGALLPAEKEFMQMYNCSLAPIRQAMSKLESLGLIERKRGKGTFVKSTNPKDYLQGGNGFSRLLYEARAHITYGTISVSKIAAESSVAEKLGIAEGLEVVKITRLGKHCDEPIQYSTHYIPDVTKLDIIRSEGDIFSWYFFVTGKLGLSIVRSLDELYISEPDEHTRKYLQLDQNAQTPPIAIERVSYDHTNRPQEYSIYTMTMSPIGGKRATFIYEVKW